MNLQGSGAPSLAPITAQGSSGPRAIDNVSMTVHREALQLGLRPWRWAWLWLAPVLLGLLYWVLAPGGTAVRVAEMNWSRDIEVERQMPVTDSGWCAQLPEGAQVLERRRLPDPVSGKVSEHCRYATRSWRAVYSLSAAGEGASPAPHWPAIAHASDERIGRRHERYETVLDSERGERWTCRLTAADWASLKTGQHLRLQVDRFGVADCASMRGSR